MPDFSELMVDRIETYGCDVFDGFDMKINCEEFPESRCIDVEDYEDMIIHDGAMLKDVPMRFRTPELCALAVYENEDAEDFVPDEIKDNEEYLMTLESLRGPSFAM